MKVHSERGKRKKKPYISIVGDDTDSSSESDSQSKSADESTERRTPPKKCGLDDKTGFKTEFVRTLLLILVLVVTIFFLHSTANQTVEVKQADDAHRNVTNIPSTLVPSLTSPPIPSTSVPTETPASTAPSTEEPEDYQFRLEESADKFFAEKMKASNEEHQFPPPLPSLGLHGASVTQRPSFSEAKALCAENCFLPQCWSNSQGNCEPAPRSAFEVATPENGRSSSQKKFTHDGPHVQPSELTCSESRDPDPFPIVPNVIGGSTPAEQILSSPELAKVRRDLFTYFTSRTLQRYYSWASVNASGEEMDQEGCNLFRSREEGVAAEDARQMIGIHSVETDGYYRIKNFCVSAVGKLYGFKPQISSYVGLDDVGSANSKENNAKDFRNWLHETKRLDQPATCYRSDIKLLIVPLWSRSENTVHVFHRVGQLLWMRKNLFAAEDNVVTAFVFPSDYAISQMAPGAQPMYWLNQTAYIQFLTLVTQSHFVVYGSGTVSERLEALLAPEHFGANLKRKLLQLAQHPLMCFSEAIVYQHCLRFDCAAARSKVVWNRPSYHTFNKRHPQLQSAIIDRIRNCTRIYPQVAPSDDLKHGTSVLLVTRSSHRRLVSAPYLRTIVASFLQKSVSSGKLTVLEMGALPNLLDLLPYYSKAQILIGVYGSGLMFGTAMASGSVAIEISFSSVRCADKTGLNLNRHCDYGGDFWNSNVQHLSFATNKVLQWADSKWKHDEIGPTPVVELVKTGNCLLQRKNESADRQRNCQSNYEEFQTMSLRRPDPSGRYLRRIIAWSFGLEVKSSEALIAVSAKVAQLLDGRRVGAKVVIVLSCEVILEKPSFVEKAVSALLNYGCIVSVGVRDPLLQYECWPRLSTLSQLNQLPGVRVGPVDEVVSNRTQLILTSQASPTQGEGDFPVVQF